MVSETERRREHILAAARELFDAQGIGATSMSSIARAARVSRGALYRCFSDKDALVDAFIEDYVRDFVDCFELWEQTRTMDARASVREFIRMLRIVLFERTKTRRHLESTESADVCLRFLGQAIDALTEAFMEMTYPGYRRRHDVEIVHVRETFRVFIGGMIMYVRSTPEADDEVLADIMMQVLRIRPSGLMPELGEEVAATSDDLSRHRA